ncbi:MAG: HD domain-containing protein [Desulfobacteraceae bacterium]|nr:MAG: HD domain-containing protein [Desulfobacteraceae bacterium]
MKRTAQFLFEVGMLKKTPRTGYQFLGSGGESVADHCFRAAIIGFVLATMEASTDRNRVVLMCLFHDLAEARTGDHNYVNKKYVKTDESKAISDQLEGLGFKDDIEKLLDEYNGCSTGESRLAKDADQLDLILELKEQLDLGNINARDWISFAVQRLSTPIGKEMAKQILDTHTTDWWFNKETDWWVNGSIVRTKES